jgi:hypothetical protein
MADIDFNKLKNEARAEDESRRKAIEAEGQDSPVRKVVSDALSQLRGTPEYKAAFEDVLRERKEGKEPSPEAANEILENVFGERVVSDDKWHRTQREEPADPATAGAHSDVVTYSPETKTTGVRVMSDERGPAGWITHEDPHLAQGGRGADTWGGAADNLRTHLGILMQPGSGGLPDVESVQEKEGVRGVGTPAIEDPNVMSKRLAILEAYEFLERERPDVSLPDISKAAWPRRREGR